MTKNTAMIAMSGGVDSAVAAYLMQQQGYTCMGAYMRMYDTGTLSPDAADAAQIASRLGFPFHVMDARALFEARVICDFISSYESGLTPNPCIQCNRHLKFGKFLDRARKLGCDTVVTGHYAQIRQDEATGRYLLCRAADPAKDQSYVLYTLTQAQLAHVRLPLGALTKTQVRAIAEAQGFVSARKQDSQDICFVPDGDYVAFMKHHTGKDYAPGDYLDLEGNVVGRHKGAVAYTLGQRRGLGVALGTPVYVCAKDMDANTVTVGPNEALFSKGLRAADWNWFPFPALTGPLRVQAKARYNQQPQPATVYPEDGGHARVEFDAPQRAITPGQAVVLYDGDLVIGGGTITEAIK